MSQTLKLVDGVIVTGDSRPVVGYAIKVGSPFSRTYAGQDYWRTSYITKILEETEDYVKFETLNSIYEWEKW
jgi:hypothetical protein